MLINPKKVSLPYNWIGHIPFVYDLVREFRPRQIVELGTHTGNSFLAMCESVHDHKLQSSVYAVDTWRGEIHSGRYTGRVYEELLDYTREHYPFATLLRKTFDEASSDFEAGSIDLLHIDGLHTYEAVKHDYEQWLPKMKDPSVLLFHDIAEKRDDFGVYQFWEELKQKQEYTFEFAHNHGLGIVLIDTNNSCSELRDWLQQHARPNGAYQIHGEWLWYQHAYREITDILKATRNSHAFRLGKLLLTPFRIIFK